MYNREPSSNDEENFQERLSPVIFWDIDKEQFDPDLYASHIIVRVLEYGTLEDWRLVKAFYGMNKIVEVCKNVRTMDPVSLAFVCAMSGTKKEDYRYYHIRQSCPHFGALETTHESVVSRRDILNA